MATNERAILGNLNRRARFYGGNDAPQLDVEDIFGILAFYGRQSCKSGEPAFSFDHVKPLKLGGENIPENIQLLTEDENKAKRDEEIDYRNGRICTREWLEQWKQEQNEAKGASGADLSKSTEQTTKDRRIKHDWNAIRFEYETNPTASLRDVARQFNVFYTLVLKRSAAEGWVKSKQNHGINLVSTAEQDVIIATSKRIVEQELNARGLLFEVIEQAVQEWQGKPRATLGDLAQILKLGLAAQNVPTEHTVIEDDNEFVDDDIVEAAERVARRANRTAEDSDIERSASDEDGASAGWTDSI